MRFDAYFLLRHEFFICPPCTIHKRVSHEDETSCDVVFKSLIRSAQYRSNARTYGFNHRHRTSARQTEPFKQIHTVERFGSVSLPETSFQFYRVRQPNARIYILYVSNNIFKYTIIVIHIIIMYLYILRVSVCMCVIRVLSIRFPLTLSSSCIVGQLAT